MESPPSIVCRLSKDTLAPLLYEVRAVCKIKAHAAGDARSLGELLRELCEQRAQKAQAQLLAGLDAEAQQKEREEVKVRNGSSGGLCNPPLAVCVVCFASRIGK